MAIPRSFLAGINLSGVLQLSSSAGTSGQVLTSAGAGATPTWTTPISATSQSSNLFYASPAGTSGLPTFRNISYLDMVTTGAPTTYGQALTYIPAGTGMGWTGPYLPLSGSSLSGNLTLSAGTATVSPLKFTSGTNLTTPVAGVEEYDGTVFYATPSVSTATTGSTVTGRGRIPAVQTFYVNADAVIVSVTSSTGSGNVLNAKSFWLAANTVYEVEYYINSKVIIGGGGSSANSYNLVLTFPTSAVGLVNIEYQANLASQTVQSTTTAWQSNTATTTNTIMASLGQGTTSYYRYRLKGTVKTGATAGYFLVQQSLTTISGMTGSVTTLAGSYAKSTVLGAAGADINIGPLT